jgi:hypothetical protein
MGNGEVWGQEVHTECGVGKMRTRDYLENLGLEESIILIEFNVLLTMHHINQYNETNVMHFSFSLLRINGLHMFRALLAHSATVPQPTDIIRIQYTKCCL